MKKNNMYFDTHRAKVYKAQYRPSSNIFLFLQTVFTVLLEGQSPMGGTPSYMRKKK